VKGTPAEELRSAPLLRWTEADYERAGEALLALAAETPPDLR
jgi:hypothetical protein